MCALNLHKNASRRFGSVYAKSLRFLRLLFFLFFFSLFSQYHIKFYYRNKKDFEEFLKLPLIVCKETITLHVNSFTVSGIHVICLPVSMKTLNEKKSNANVNRSLWIKHRLVTMYAVVFYIVFESLWSKLQMQKLFAWKHFQILYISFET